MATNIKNGKQTAIIFVRCSSSGYQIGRQDTTRQIADLEAYAKYSNLKVVKTFEEHISGVKENLQDLASESHLLLLADGSVLEHRVY